MGSQSHGAAARTLLVPRPFGIVAPKNLSERTAKSVVVLQIGKIVLAWVSDRFRKKTKEGEYVLHILSDHEKENAL